MKSIDWKCCILFLPLGVGMLAMNACGGSSSSAPPASAAEPPASAAPLASASPPPAASAASTPPAALAPAASADPSSHDEDDEVAAELVEHHRHHHHGGVTRFIAMSLDTLGITPDQRVAIEKIQAELHDKLAPARTAERAFVTLLADEIAAGKIDATKLDAAIARVGAASGASHAAVADSLNQLHTVLDDAQRAALVDKVEAHWQVWREANAGAPEGGEPHEHGRLEALAKELSLTPEQVATIRASLHAAPGPRQHLGVEKVTAYIGAFGTAFEGSSFDAKTLKSGDSVNAHLASWGATTMARFYGAVVPALLPDQRSNLAEHVREHASHDDAPTAE